MIKKILLSIGSIAAVGALAFGATQAFFSDTETSVGNLLQAGAIDLKVDNTCYYNGQACTNGVFGGNVGIGNTTPCTCTFASKDLSEGDVFFELTDIKPGDWEEDTISLTVEDNAAWLCADVTLRSDEDVTCTEPESESTDPECITLTPVPGDGELAEQVEFLWWADDGDNVLEQEESSLPSGPLGNLNVNQTANVTLADSSNNIWSELPNDPIPQGGDTWYVGKAWCFGDITAAPLPQAGYSGPNNPTNDGVNTSGPATPEDGGFNCDGSVLGNESQTDRLTADIGFRAVQSRNNSPFFCQSQQ